MLISRRYTRDLTLLGTDTIIVESLVGLIVYHVRHIPFLYRQQLACPPNTKLISFDGHCCRFRIINKIRRITFAG